MRSLVAAALAVGIVTAPMLQVMAHEWYDRDCCSGKDCAPVINMMRSERGDMFYRTEHGLGLFIKGQSQIRLSKDAQIHACLGFDGVGRQTVRCLYLPGTSGIDGQL